MQFVTTLVLEGSQKMEKVVRHGLMMGETRDPLHCGNSMQNMKREKKQWTWRFDLKKREKPRGNAVCEDNPQLVLRQ
jgi:hypothetical protein